MEGLPSVVDPGNLPKYGACPPRFAHPLLRHYRIETMGMPFFDLPTLKDQDRRSIIKEHIRG